MDLAKLLILLALLGGVAGYIAQHDRNTATLAVAKAGEESAKKSAVVLQEVIDNADSLSKIRAKEIADLKARNNSLATELAKLGGDARRWLDAAVPDDIRRLRRDTFAPSGVGLVLRPDAGAAANPGATAERREGEGSGTGSERQPGRSDVVQQGQSGRTEVTPAAEQTTSILKRIRALRGEK